MNIIVRNIDDVICENRKAEILLKEVYRMKPDVKFITYGSIITEDLALILYEAVHKNKDQKDRLDMVYVPIIKA